MQHENRRDYLREGRGPVKRYKDKEMVVGEGMKRTKAF